MSAVSPSALPTPLKRRADIVGLASGVLCLPISLVPPRLGQPNITPASVVLPLVFVSIVAGSVGCLLAFSAEEEASGSRPRVGIRAGWIAAVFAGAVTVSLATVRAFAGAGAPIQSGTLTPLFQIIPEARPFAVLAITLIGIPPAIFFGLSGAVIAGMRRLPPTGPGRSAPSRAASSPAFLAVVLLSALGYLSPFAVLLRPKPKPIVAVRSIPAPVPAASTPAPIPKWRYQKPSGFNAAEAQEVTVSDIRNLGEVDPTLPFALSADQRKLASFRRSSGATLQIHDLDSLDLLTQVELPQPPAALAWSPDGERIIVSTATEPRHYQVIYLGTGRVANLPQPAGYRMPQGRLVWWRTDEVLLPSDGVQLLLHLDTLRIRPAKDFDAWNALAKEEQDRLVRMPAHLPKADMRKPNLQPAVLAYDPVVGALRNDLRRERLHLVLESPHSSYLRPLPRLDLTVDDALLATDDGTRIIRFRNQQAVVFCLTLRDTPPLRLSVSMPGPPDEALRARIEKKTLSAFVCSPLVNPLNGATVGPDRSRVKAIARIIKWSGNSAELWIAEDYAKVVDGDVAADLHQWEGGKADYLSKFQEDQWFSAVRDLDTAPPPKRSEVSPLERGWSVSVDVTGSADRIVGINLAYPDKPRQAAAPAPKPATATPAPAAKDIFDQVLAQRPTATPAPPLDVNRPMVYVQATPAPPRAAPVDSDAAVRRFMTDHSAKIGRGEIESYVRDFTNPVDYLDGEIVRRDKLLNHIRGLTMQFKGMRETILSMDINQLSPTAFEVLTTAEHSSVSNGVRGVGGRQSLSTTVIITPNGPQITKVRDLAK